MEENLFRLYRKRAGYSQKEAAEALNVTAAAVSSWEVGRYLPDPQNLSALADLYGVTVDHLLGRTTPLESFGRQIGNQAELQPEDEVMIPLVASLRCGPGTNGEPFTYIKPIPIPASYVRRWGDGLQAIIAVGESMSPTIIPGDMCICRPGDAWENGNVVSESRKVIFNYTLPKVGHQYDSVPPSLNKNMSGVGSQSAHNPSAPPVGDYSHAQRISPR